MQVAAKNEKITRSYSQDVAEIELVMQVTYLAINISFDFLCIRVYDSYKISHSEGMRITFWYWLHDSSTINNNNVSFLV